MPSSVNLKTPGFIENRPENAWKSQRPQLLKKPKSFKNPKLETLKGVNGKQEIGTARRGKC